MIKIIMVCLCIFQFEMTWKAVEILELYLEKGEYSLLDLYKLQLVVFVEVCFNTESLGSTCFALPVYIFHPFHIKRAVTRDFQQSEILTSVDSDEPVQPRFKLRNLK